MNVGMPLHFFDRAKDKSRRLVENFTTTLECCHHKEQPGESFYPLDYIDGGAEKTTIREFMSLIQPLPAGSLDIVGDIHGEYGALCSLLDHLGYDQQGHHPDGRTLVFVGDFCDRGPDSPAVLARVQALVESGRAAAVLGNH